jgi:hypothetical protein
MEEFILFISLQTQLPVILAHEPSTVSSATAFHYFQSIHTGDFRLYNKGFRDLPPKYNLTNVKVPVALFWGSNDILCTPVVSYSKFNASLWVCGMYPKSNHLFQISGCCTACKDVTQCRN